MYLGALVGMSQDEFWNSTPKYLDARKRAYEQHQQLAWEQARYVAFFVIKTVDSKNKFKDEQSITLFPWEKRKKHELELPTEEEWNKVDEELDNALKVLNPEAYERYMAGRKN